MSPARTPCASVAATTPPSAPRASSRGPSAPQHGRPAARADRRERRPRVDAVRRAVQHGATPAPMASRRPRVEVAATARGGRRSRLRWRSQWKADRMAGGDDLRRQRGSARDLLADQEERRADAAGRERSSTAGVPARMRAVVEGERHRRCSRRSASGCAARAPPAARPARARAAPTPRPAPAPMRTASAMRSSPGVAPRRAARIPRRPPPEAARTSRSTGRGAASSAAAAGQLLAVVPRHVREPEAP